MTPRRVDLPEAIRLFVTRLRREVPGISPAEALDAVRAVAACGVEDRETFRYALRATLVKRHEDRDLFDREFTRYFTAPRASRRERRGRGRSTPGEGSGRTRASRPPVSPAAAHAAARAARLATLRRRVEPARRRRGRLQILVSRQETRDPSSPCPSGRDGARAAGRGEPRSRPAGPARDGMPFRRSPRTPGLFVEDDRRLAEEIPRLVSAIRLRAGRRHRARRRGRPWPARLMRRSLATGGVPFAIPARRRRPRRPSVILMVDVSWSVLRASACFLRMALEFLRARPRVSVLLFVDRCIEGEALLGQWDRASTRSFERLLESATGLDPDAPSDYGRAFWQAATARRGPLASRRRDAVLVVLGDGRSNRLDPQTWAFEAIAARCRRVIWIAPEPESRWGTGDSALAEYLPHCDVLCEARDLEGLALGVAECVRSL